MADQDVKKLLVKLGIDTRDFRTAVQDIRKALEDVNAEEVVRADEKRRRVKDDVVQAKAVSDRAKQLGVEFKNQLQQKQLLVTNEKVLQEQAKTGVNNERLKTAEIQKQTAEIRRQMLQARSQGAGGGGVAGSVIPGAALNAAQALGSAALGGGTLGSFWTALLAGAAGGGMVALFQVATQAAAGFVSEIHNLITQSDSLVNIQNTFEKMSAGIGAEPTKFIKDLQVATHGLVGDTELMAQANKLLLQGLPFTEHQITNLTGSVSKLALMQGKPLAESFGMVMRALTSGRVSMLAYNLGLEESVKKQLAYAATMPDSIRLTSEFEIIQKAVNTQLEKMPDHVDTLGTKTRQVGVAFGDFINKISNALAQSEGAQKFSDMLDTIIEQMKNGEGPVNTFVNAFNSLATAITGAYNAYEKLDKWNKDHPLDFGLFSSPKEKSEEVARKVVQPLPGGYTTTSSVEMALQAARAKLATFPQTPPKPIDWEQAKKDADVLAAHMGQIAQQVADKEKAELDKRTQNNKEFYSTGKIDLVTYTKEADAIRVAQEQSAVKLIYSQAEARKKALDVESRHAQSSDVTDDMRVEIQRQVSEKIAAIDEETNTKILASGYQRDANLKENARALIEDLRQAELARQQSIIQLQMAAAKNRETILEDEYKQGRISTERYLEDKKFIWAEEFELFRDLEENKTAAANQNEKTRADSQARVAKEAQDRAERIVALDKSQPQLETQRLQEMYQYKIGLAQDQVQLADAAAKNQYGLLPTIAQTDAQAAAIQNLITEYQKFLDQQEELIAASLAAGDATSDTYRQLVTSVSAATVQIATLHDRLQQLPTITDRLAHSLSSFANALQTVGGHWESFGKGLMPGIKLLESLIQYRHQAEALGIGRTTTTPGLMNMYGGVTEPTTTFKPAGSPIEGLADLFYGDKSMFNKGVKGVVDNLEKFITTLGATIESVGGFVQAIQGIGGPAQAGIQGLASGLGLGGGIGSILGKLGGLGETAGPIGAAIGAGIGLITGIIGGSKRKATENVARQIKEQFNFVIAQYQEHALTLKQTIEATEKERDDAIRRLSGRSGGKDQLNQLLPQMEQTLSQMRAARQKIFEEMDKTLQVLRQPQALQSQVQAINQVIEKFHDYIDAGGNVIKANEFLTLSFEQMRVDAASQFTSAEQDAIQNALQYNDLLIQREKIITDTNDRIIAANKDIQDLIDQTDKSIRAILSSGSATRQQTTAMKMGEQINKLTTDRDTHIQELQKVIADQRKASEEQLHNLDLQLALTKYRLEAESKIFTMATDRVAMELQLLTLQENQIDRDMERIAALTNLEAEQATATGAPRPAPPEAPRVPRYWTLPDGSAITNDQYQRMIAGQGVFGAIWRKAGIPHYQQGGVVPKDQLAYVHKDETIIPADGANTFATTLKAALQAHMAQLQERVNIESQILSLASSRVLLEAEILDMRMAEITALHSVLLTQGQSSNQSLESMTQKLYAQRQRQGSAGFSRDNAGAF